MELKPAALPEAFRPKSYTKTLTKLVDNFMQSDDKAALFCYTKDEYFSCSGALASLNGVIKKRGYNAKAVFRGSQLYIVKCPPDEKEGKK